MALGARRSDIGLMFLLEATGLTVVGAVAGGTLGLAAIILFTLVSGWHFTADGGSLALGVGSSVLIGMFFGIYPARAASRLLPVQALRDE